MGKEKSDEPEIRGTTQSTPITNRSALDLLDEKEEDNLLPSTSDKDIT